MYRLGKGVPQDDAEALKWFRLAADHGNSDAQYNLGVMYATGAGVPQDDAGAVKWYRMAAERGNGDAQYNLGDMYAKGKGVPQSYIAAYMWYNFAGAHGSVMANARRESVAAQMTSADIAEAERRAKVCMASNYQDCD